MPPNKITEKPNINSKGIDQKPIQEIIKIINDEDKTIALAVEDSLNDINIFIKALIEQVEHDGRLFYLGSGTSGRLGVLDASECPPTFSVDHSMVQGIIAGGDSALIKSSEGTEDSIYEGKEAIINNKISDKDVVLGISASGDTPFVIGGLEEAKKTGATTGLLLCNNIKKLSFIDYFIPVIVGPEIIAGSTRMKGGTATKMVLNMITTTLMIRLNKTYDNLMVDLNASNNKLWNRGCQIIENLTSLNRKDALKLLKTADGEVKTAVLMFELGVNKIIARQILRDHSGSLRASLL